MYRITYRCCVDCYWIYLYSTCSNILNINISILSRCCWITTLSTSYSSSLGSCSYKNTTIKICWSTTTAYTSTSSIVSATSTSCILSSCITTLCNNSSFTGTSKCVSTWSLATTMARISTISSCKSTTSTSCRSICSTSSSTTSNIYNFP